MTIDTPDKKENKTPVISSTLYSFNTSINLLNIDFLFSDIFSFIFSSELFSFSSLINLSSISSIDFASSSNEVDILFSELRLSSSKFLDALDISSLYI